MSKKEETRFKEKILPQLRKLGYFVKIQQATIAGTPDILGTINGVFIALELKTDIGRASQLQEVNFLKILKAGGIALQVSPSNWSETYRYLSALKRNYQVKKYRKYLLKSLQSHAEEIDK